MEHREHVEHRVSEEAARKLLDEWHWYLAALDPHRVPEGFSHNRWAKLVQDCWWLYETHCSRLARDCWTALDLFAVFPSQAGWGGLADRLQGVHNLRIEDGWHVSWERAGARYWMSRGLSRAFRDSAFQMVWDFKI